MYKLSKRIIAVIIVFFLASLAIPQASAQELPREQGFRIMQEASGPVPDLNPFNPSTPGATIFNGASGPYAVYETLAYWDLNSGEMKGCLAESWSWVDDYTFEIKLHPEAHFRDGTPVAAEDVVFTYNSRSEPEYGGAPIIPIDSVEAVDEHTVHINLKEEYPHNRLIYNFLTYVAWQIIPEERWSKLLDQYENEIVLATPNLDNPEAINGSGPYTIDTVTPERIIFKKVEDYWGEQIGWYYLPKYVDEYFYGSSESAVRAIQGREVDWIWVGHYNSAFWSNLSDFAYRNPEGTKSEMFPHDAAYMVIIPNPEKWWVQYTWLRKALNYAIDVDAIMMAGYEGMASPDPPTFIHPDDPYYDELVNKEVLRETYPKLEVGYEGHLYIPYDPDLAIEILENHCEGSVEEGWTYEGKEIGGWTIQAVSGWGDVMTLVRSVAKDWREIGISAQPDFPDYGSWVSNWNTMNFDWMQLWHTAPLVGASAAGSFEGSFVGPHTNIWIGNAAYKYQVYYTEDYPEYPNTADNVRQLLLDLYGMEKMSDEYIQTVKQLQGIIVPQVTCAFTVSKAVPEGMLLDRWVNYPSDFDPYEHHQNVLAPHFYLKHVYPRNVDTVDFSLSSDTVAPGDSVTAEVSLMNKGDADQEYAVYVRNGAPKAGPGPEVVAHTCVSVPAGETVTAELDVSFAEEGTYTLTVDDWRIDKLDPGDPKTRILTVGAGLGPEYTIEDAITAANEAKDAAEDATAAAEEARNAAREAGGASTGMVLASMLATIIVVLGGVYAITRRRAQ